MISINADLRERLIIEQLEARPERSLGRKCVLVFLTVVGVGAPVAGFVSHRYFDLDQTAKMVVGGIAWGAPLTALSLGIRLNKEKNLKNLIYRCLVNPNRPDPEQLANRIQNIIKIFLRTTGTSFVIYGATALSAVDVQPIGIFWVGTVFALLPEGIGILKHIGDGESEAVINLYRKTEAQKRLLELEMGSTIYKVRAVTGFTFLLLSILILQFLWPNRFNDPNIANDVLLPITTVSNAAWVFAPAMAVPLHAEPRVSPIAKSILRILGTIIAASSYFSMDRYVHEYDDITFNGTFGNSFWQIFAGWMVAFGPELRMIWHLRRTPANYQNNFPQLEEDRLS